MPKWSLKRVEVTSFLYPHTRRPRTRSEPMKRYTIGQRQRIDPYSGALCMIVLPSSLFLVNPLPITQARGVSMFFLKIHSYSRHRVWRGRCGVSDTAGAGRNAVLLLFDTFSFSPLHLPKTEPACLGPQASIVLCNRSMPGNRPLETVSKGLPTNQ